MKNRISYRVALSIVNMSLLLLSTICRAQQINPAPGNRTVCPSEAILYSVTADPSTYSGCGRITWTVTKGSFNGTNSQTTKETDWGQSVAVYWNDEAEIGTLKATAACSTGGSLTVGPISYTIRSLKNQTPQNLSIKNGGALPVCSMNTLHLGVDRLSVPNTGFGTSIPVYEANGYEWKLSEPNNWLGVSNTELISISPTSPCAGGTIQVRAYITSCSGLKYSEWTTPIALRQSVPFVIKANNNTSYNVRCGNSDPVTFTATDIACAGSYTWNFPSGWRAGGQVGPITTTTNSITLTPLSTPGNAAGIPGPVSATVNWGCGAYQASMNVSYSDPILSTPVFSSTNTSVLCSNGAATIAIEPVASASSYTWYTSSDGTIYVNGNIITASNPFVTSSSNVTVSVPSVSSTGGYGSSVHVVANAKPGCAGSAKADHYIWAGPPKRDVFIEGPGMMVDGNILYTYNVGYTGATNYTWSLNNNVARIRFTSSSPLENIMTASLQRFIGEGVANLSLLSENSCGTSVIGPRPIRVGPCPGEMNNTGCGIIIERTPGTPDAALSVYPNPASQQINIELLPDVMEPGTTNPVTVRLLNSKAEVVYTAHLSSETISIPVNNFPRGYYVVKIQRNDEELTRTVWIEH
jgi:hypothetical protein